MAAAADPGQGCTPASEADDYTHYDYIRFTWSDINGVARSKIVPRDHLETANVKGVGIYAGILAFGPQSQPVVPPEVEAARHGNAVVRPDLSTLHPLPWAGGPGHGVGEYLCDLYWPSGRPQPACPRHLAARQCARLTGRGLRIMAAFELEFTLLEEQGQRPAWTDHGMCSNVVLSKYEPLLYDVEKAVRAAGVHVEALQAEYAQGQCELTLSPKFGLQSADDFFITKQAVKEVAAQQGLTATFMAKPLVGEAGNGAHFNHSLWDLTIDNNLLHDPTAQDHLSKLALHWLAGLAHHARALTALSCPTVNCYRRLHAVWAPANRHWGLDDRRATFRVKNTSPADTYIENRLPSGCANPYLVLAATVAAGLDGLDRELTFLAPCGKDERPLPYDLGEALVDLEEDEVLRGALGEEFVRWFCQSKREVDLKELPTGPHPATNYTEDDALRERAMYTKFM